MRLPTAIAVLLAALAAVPAADAKTAPSRTVRWATPNPYINPPDSRYSSYSDPSPRIVKPYVLVRLPRGYRKSRCYPVLYLLNGHGYPDEWESKERGKLAQTAKGFRGIIVEPVGGHGWYANWWNDGYRKPAWERYHLDVVVPLIERRLNICSGRRNHAIAGLSMGGEGAVFYASQRPGYFGTAASFSGTLSIQRGEWQGVALNTLGEPGVKLFGDPAGQEWYWAGHNPTALVSNLRYTRVYVGVGDGKPIGSTRGVDQQTLTTRRLGEAEVTLQAHDFLAAARPAGVPVSFYRGHGDHDWPNWRRELKQAIRWGLFKKVPTAPKAWTYSTVAAHSAAWGYRFDWVSGFPEELVTFTYTNGILHAKGSGTVRVTTPTGVGFTRSIPFTEAPEG